VLAIVWLAIVLLIVEVLAIWLAICENIAQEIEDLLKRSKKSQ